MNPSHPASPKDELQSEGREQPPQPGLAAGQGRGGAGCWHAEQSRAPPANPSLVGKRQRKGSKLEPDGLFGFVLLFFLIFLGCFPGRVVLIFQPGRPAQG